MRRLAARRWGAVISRPSVTVSFLTYRNPAWMNLCLEGLAYARNSTPAVIRVVGCDAEDSVVTTGRLDQDFRSPDPSEHYLSRVYRAWNAAVESAPTELVCLLNDDMVVSDYWLDELVDAKLADSKTVPCSLLVESGRIPSAMPEYCRDFGLTPDTLDVEGWRLHAATVRKAGETEPGRLFMPCLLERETFSRLGSYPLGNPPGTTGDKDLFARLTQAGYRHVTALGSVCYHVQSGAMLEGEAAGR